MFCTVEAVAELARTRLKNTKYRHGLLDGFITDTGLTAARLYILAYGRVWKGNGQSCQ